MYNDLISQVVEIHQCYGLPCSEAAAEVMEDIGLDPVSRRDIFECLVDQAAGLCDY